MPNLGRWSSQRARYRVALLLTELPAAASAFELRASNHSFGVLSTTFEPQLNKPPQTTTENVYLRHILHILKRGRRKEVTFRKALSLRIETVPKKLFYCWPRWRTSCLATTAVGVPPAPTTTSIPVLRRRGQPDGKSKHESCADHT